MQTGHPAARSAGVSAVVRIDGNRPEGSAREGGGSSGGNRNNSGFRFRGLAGRAKGGREEEDSQGTSKSCGMEWSGVERGGI